MADQDLHVGTTFALSKSLDASLDHVCHLHTQAVCSGLLSITILVYYLWACLPLVPWSSERNFYPRLKQALCCSAHCGMGTRQRKQKVFKVTE